MSQLIKMGTTAAGTAIGGPFGGVIGAGLGGFGGSVAEGQNFYNSLGSGVTGGAMQGIMNGMDFKKPKHEMSRPVRAAETFGGSPSQVTDSNSNLMDVLSRARKPKKYMYAGQEQLGMPPEYLEQMMGSGNYWS